MDAQLSKVVDAAMRLHQLERAPASSTTSATAGSAATASTTTASPIGVGRPLQPQFGSTKDVALICHIGSGGRPERGGV